MTGWSASVGPKTHGCVPCKSNMPRSRPGLGRLSRSRPGAGCPSTNKSGAMHPLRSEPGARGLPSGAARAKRIPSIEVNTRPRARRLKRATAIRSRKMRTAKSSPSNAAGGRRRRIGACLRVLALIVLIPLGLAAVFVGSYVLTCIINGATPEEVLDVLAAMPSRVESFVRSVMAM